MIVEYAEILNDLGKNASLTIQKDHEAVEAWIKAATGHDWEDTDYSELVNGSGTHRIYLDHYPVSTITEISPITPGIKIKNTSTDARNAYVSVDSDSLDLVVAEGTNVMSESEAFATYTTLTLMVAQINAEAKGWEASLYDSDFGSYAVGCLLPVKNMRCGAWNGIAPSDSYLDILGKPLSGYRVDDDIGEVYYPYGFVKGYRNYMAKYSAYASGQADIQEAVKQAVKFLVKQREDNTEGIASYSTGDLTVKFDSIMPSGVLDVVKLHSKVM